MITPEGIVIEGRGFWREGQTTFESLTSYNNKAIAISFIVESDSEQPNEKQQDALCLFLKKSIEDGDLDKNYKVFHHLALTGTSRNYNLEYCRLDWRERKFNA